MVTFISGLRAEAEKTSHTPAPVRALSRIENEPKSGSNFSCSGLIIRRL